MSIEHHLDSATIMAFAAGTLSPGVALVASCHVDVCPLCREEVIKAQAIGGALLDSQPKANMSEDALSLALARLDDEETVTQAPVQQLAEAKDVDFGTDLMPKSLRPYIDAPLDELKWRTIVPGVKVYDLPVSGRDSTRLLRISPGVPIMHHSHKGVELTMVLRGSFSDEIGRFKHGDIADLDEQTTHQPVTDTHVDCICLVATDAPLKFSSFVGRLVQPLLGF